MGEDALGEDIEHFLRMKEAGNSYVMLYQLTANKQSDFPEVWAVGRLSSAQTAFTLADRRDLEDNITNTDIDLSKFDDRTIDGRIYTTGPNKKFDHTYEDRRLMAESIWISKTVNGKWAQAQRMWAI